jgi:arylsulfatase A-like enzyme
MNSIRTWLWIFCCVVSSHALGATPAKPNVVLILADDLGYGDLGSYGATKVSTPNLDRLAREGTRFTHAYTPGSVCSPTRYSLLSGRYFWRNLLHPPTGVLDPGAPLLFEEGRMNLPQFFKNQGYATAAIGKWHLGIGRGPDHQSRFDWNQEEIKPGPLECGFDYFYGMAANVGNEPAFYFENRSFVGRKKGDVVKVGRRNKVEPWTPEVLYRPEEVGGEIARKAVSWIEQSGPQPFFLYVASNIPHHDVLPAPESLGKSQCGPYGDFVQELDGHVGQILAALEKKGVLDQTMVIFTSDNGGVVTNAARRLEPYWQALQAGHHICGALRGRKHGIYEGGFRVPFIVRWPGQIPSGRACDAMVGLTDVMATCAAAIGAPLPETAAEDSVNLWPLWRGDEGAKGRESVVLKSSNAIFAVREGFWKLIEQKPTASGETSEPENTNQLYDLSSDPAETRNRWEEEPEVVSRLRKLLERTRKQAGS